MTTTREKALEAALRACLPHAERIAATTPTTPTRSQRQHEAAAAARQARAALALPPDQPAAPAPVAAGEWLRNGDVVQSRALEIVACRGSYAPEVKDGSHGATDWEKSARLIAAAPDMLAALQGLVAWDKAQYGDEGANVDWSGFDDAMSIVRAAIARATGREG